LHIASRLCELQSSEAIQNELLQSTSMDCFELSLSDDDYVNINLTIV